MTISVVLLEETMNSHSLVTFPVTLPNYRPLSCFLSIILLPDRRAPIFFRFFDPDTVADKSPALGASGSHSGQSQDGCSRLHIPETLCKECQV